MEQSDLEKQALSAQERSRQILIRTVPPHMMLLASERMKTAGETLREDVTHYLNVASVAPLSGLNDLELGRMAQRTDEIATHLIRELNPNDPKEVFIAACGFILRLVDEGLMPDPGNQSVLCALHIMDEVYADPGGWNYNPFRIKQLTDNMMVRAKLQGLIS